MGPASTLYTQSLRKSGVWILFGTLMAVIAMVGCSSNSGQAGTPKPVSASLRPAKLETVAAAVSPPAPITLASKTALATQPPASGLITYRSRDYGISLLYPWQYAFVSAKGVAGGDTSRRPKPDGHDGQITLARIEIPQGFYPDTDFESGYLTVSLNQDLTEQQCQSALAPADTGTLQGDTINGVEFRWIETDSGGHGSAVKQRNYVAFTNETCYELEMAVRTSNQHGLAREVDPDQVLRRLDTILRTFKIMPAMNTAVAAK